jgi:hypothetical protein
VFYNKVKALADTLASIGQPLTDSKFNSYIVNGLDEDYDGLVEIINEHANTNALMAHEVYSRLVSPSSTSRRAVPTTAAATAPLPTLPSGGATAPMVLCLPPRARGPAHLPIRHRPPPRTLLGEVVHLMYVSSAAVMHTMHPCVIAVFSKVFLGSTTTARIRATTRVK